MAESEPSASTLAGRSTSPEPQRPPLPPRPSQLLQVRPNLSNDHRTNTQGTLTSGATTAVSITDVNTYSHVDALRTTVSRRTSSATLNNLASTRASEKGDDSFSIRSSVPFSPPFSPTPAESASLFGDGPDCGDTPLTQEADLNFLEPEVDIDFREEFENVSTSGDDEELVLAAWKAKKKHFIILSAAGKPIYTRHGSDSLISSYVGIIQTIISFYKSASNQLRSFTAGTTKFVVLSQTNLFLVAISTLQESESQLRVQLEALYMQILSTLTLPTLTHIFSVRPSTDLRRPLQGTEPLLSSLADSFTRGSPSTLLSALECLKLRKSQRTQINSTFIRSRVDDLLYGLIVAGGRLVSVIRPKKHSLHPSDLQLIFNMLFEAEGVHAGGGDAWIPICLPGFNNTGYLYMYVSFLDTQPQTQDQKAIRELSEHTAPPPPSNSTDDTNNNNQRQTPRKEDVVAIILLSTNKESFESLRSMKTYMVHDLRRNGGMRAIQQSIAAGRPSIADILSPQSTSTPPKSTPLPIQHFLYKSKSHVQFLQPSPPNTATTTNPSPSPSPTPTTPSPSQDPASSPAQTHRALLSIYATLHASLHPTPPSQNSRSTLSKPQLHHHTSPSHSALAWSSATFELYCVGLPGTSRRALEGAAGGVVKWVQKEEERVFIIGGAVF